jgi:hypothetical protein
VCVPKDSNFSDKTGFTKQWPLLFFESKVLRETSVQKSPKYVYFSANQIVYSDFLYYKFKYSPIFVFTHTVLLTLGFSYELESCVFPVTGLDCEGICRNGMYEINVSTSMYVCMYIYTVCMNVCNYEWARYLCTYRYNKDCEL